MNAKDADMYAAEKDTKDISKNSALADIVMNELKFVGVEVPEGFYEHIRDKFSSLPFGEHNKQSESLLLVEAVDMCQENFNKEGRCPVCGSYSQA